jgi:ABC-type phosphate/phosphonate transport system substrate-binding protein
MIASFRMYNAGTRAAAAWRALFSRVFADTGVAIEIVEHRWPQPIDSLWTEPRLACDFMCGWPFVRARRPMKAIAAPVPSPERYGHQPRYCSEFVVREASGWTRLQDTFGHRFGWMARSSQSGFNAPRAHLAAFITSARRSLYAESKGPLGAPMGVLEALRAGEVDVVALDSFFLDLCRRHEPAALAGMRCVGTTPWMPIPLLVASPATDDRVVQRLRARLLGLGDDAAYAPLMADVLLERFAAPDVTAYKSLESMARYAAARDYEAIR